MGARRTSPTERGAAMLLAGLVGAVIVAAIALPLQDARERRDQALFDAGRIIAAQRRALAKLPALEARKAALAVRPSDVEGALVAATEATAAAAIQQEISRRFESAGARVASIAPAPSQKIGELQRISVLVDASLPEPRLPDLLKSFTGGTPILLVERLDLRATAFPGAGSVRTEPNRLHLTGEIQALVRIAR